MHSTVEFNVIVTQNMKYTKNHTSYKVQILREVSGLKNHWELYMNSEGIVFYGWVYLTSLDRLSAVLHYSIETLNLETHEYFASLNNTK